MEIEVANKKIGENHPVLIIAEAGVCHDGDIEKAKELVDIAKDCGVDIVKFQTWKTEELCLEDSEKAEYQKEQTGTDENQFDMIKKLELSYEDFIELRSYCDKKGIIFMSTPDEEKSAKFLIESVNIPAIKIGSGEITNHHYQKYLAAFKRPLIISTGMGTMEDVKTIKEITDGQNNDKVIFLHCTTDYPAKYEDSNINAMVTMKKELGTIIGYSDHTMGIYVPLVAVALGAEVIEKHFTYSRLAEGPDHKASLTPDQLKEMVEEIRELEKIPPEENEAVVNSILKELGDKIKLEKISLPIKTRERITSWEGQKYSSKVKKCARIYPQDNDTEGFFIAKFKKK